MVETVSMWDAGQEQERKEREQKFTWAREWSWGAIVGFITLFGNKRLVGGGEQKISEETECIQVGGLKFMDSLFLKSLKSAAMTAGLVDGPTWKRKYVAPRNLWLFDEIENEHQKVRKKLKKARTTKEISGAVGIKRERAEQLAKSGDVASSVRLSNRAATLNKRLGTARTYMREALVYVYFMRMHGYNVHDMNPDTLALCYGTVDQNYEDGVMQKQQRKWCRVKNAFTEDEETGEKVYCYAVRSIQNHITYAVQFAKLLYDNKVFAAYNEDGDLTDIVVLPDSAGKDAAKPNPYRITLDKYLNFPKGIYAKHGRVLPDVNEILLIYHAIHLTKDNPSDVTRKIAKHAALYAILIRVLRESGARPANLRWLRWRDFVLDEDDPRISWVHANHQKEKGKSPPDTTYISPLLAQMIITYYEKRDLNPQEYFIKNEFIPGIEAMPLTPLSEKNLSKVTTLFLQEVINEVYKDRDDVLRLLGSSIGAKRFRKSLATLIYGTVKDAQTDEKIIPKIFGDSLETLEKFYTEERGARKPRIVLAARARNKYSQLDLANKIFDKELPPGVSRTQLYNFCKPPDPKKKR